MTVTRRGLMAGSLSALLVPSLALAQSPATAPAVITRFYAVLEQVMKDGRKTPFPQRFQLLAPAVDQAFDLAGILRVSVGAYWTSLPPAEQQQLLTEFRAFTVASYISNFHSYKNRVLTVFPTTRAVGSQQVVKTTIQKPHRDAVRIDYVMRNEASGWKVVDVLLDGTISRVATQRSDFSSYVSQGNASRLITLLKRKVSTLSDGAMAG